LTETDQPPTRPAAPAPSRRSRAPWLRWAMFALAGVLVVGLGIEGLRLLEKRPMRSASASRDVVPVVRVVPATRGPAESELALPGDITALEDSPVYARVNGYVRRWLVDIGAKVKAGDLLAEIETPELHQQLKQAQALVLQAKANVEIARITYNRYQGLVRTNAVSQQDVDNSLAAWEARKADVAAAEAEVGRLQAMTDFQKIYAPFDGVIGARNLQKATTGALIDLGSQDPKAWLYRVYRMDNVRVYVSVPQNYLPLIKDGMAADVWVREFPGRIFNGRVVRSAAALNVASRTMLIEVDVPNPDGVLLPGMYSTVRFKLVNPAPPIVVNDTSIIVLSGAPQVAVVDAQDVIRLRKIRLGRDFGITAEVLSGLEPGERVVLNPNDLLTEGTKVRVQTPSPPKP
jgi:RND family efflux transporter MFP subunit